MVGHVQEVSSRSDELGHAHRSRTTVSCFDKENVPAVCSEPILASALFVGCRECTLLSW